MNSLFILLLLVLNVSFSLASAGFYSKSEVVELTPSMFKEFYSSKHLSVVEFYAPWCGHCQKLKSEYIKAAKSLKGVVKVGAVNCAEDINKPLCAKHGIKGFPTIKIIRPAKPEIKDGKVKRGRPVMEDYNGQRVGKDISSFALSRLRSAVTTLKEDTVDKFISQSLQQPTFVLMAGKKRGTPTVPPVLKVLSIEYYGKAKFGYVSTKFDMWNKFGVSKHPSAKLLLVRGKDVVEYDGILTKEGLSAFIDEQIAEWKVKRDDFEEPLETEKDKSVTEESLNEESAEKSSAEEPVTEERLAEEENAAEDGQCASENSDDAENVVPNPSKTENTGKASEDQADQKRRKEKEEAEKYLAKKFGAKEFNPKFDASRLKENGITPEAKARNPLTRISSYNDLVEKCVKSDKICILLATSGYGQLEDFKSLNGGRKSLSQDDQDKLAIHYLVDVNDELRYIAEEFQMIPYREPRAKPKGTKKGPATWTHEGAMVAINGKQNWMIHMPDYLGVTSIKQFLEQVLADDQRLVKQQLPGRYVVSHNHDDSPLHRSHDDL